MKLSVEKRRARKNHACHFCDETIHTGSSYYRTAYLHDGEIYVEKTHVPPEYEGYCYEEVTDHDDMFRLFVTGRGGRR